MGRFATCKRRPFETNTLLQIEYTKNIGTPTDFLFRENMLFEMLIPKCHTSQPGLGKATLKALVVRARLAGAISATIWHRNHIYVIKIFSPNS